MWTLLLVTLPTQPGAVRLRIWRNLKALGCVALRDGAYVLPAEHAAAFEQIAREVQSHGGTAAVFDLATRTAPQHDELVAQFSRAEAYAAWREQGEALRGELSSLTETDARRKLRGFTDALATLERSDYFPGVPLAQAQAFLTGLRREFDARFSAGEPRPAAGEIARLNRARYLGKRWATRARPWVDRLACAWFVRRFIDAEAQFIWLKEPPKPPRGVLGFDFDGATFSHVGALVTLEVMAASFGFDGDERLRRVARAVHYLDVGGIPVPEAAGLETILGGLRDLHVDDDQLLAAACSVFDALYVAQKGGTE
jgi:hypothetical protein